MKQCTRLIVMAGLTLSWSLQAAEQGQRALIEQEQAAQTFMRHPGFIEQDIETLKGSQYYSTTIFPDYSPDSGQMFYPDAQLNALTQAILLVEAHEPALPHVRYKVEYSLNSLADHPRLRHEYLQVTRYNLGPARRDDLLQYVEADHVAPASEFGVGAHVSWRFMLMPLMGRIAEVTDAARKEVSQAEAQQAQCLSIPCLSLDSVELPAEGKFLTQRPVPALASPTYRAYDPPAIARPARALEEVAATIGLEESELLMYRNDKPHFEFVISQDVVGQDSFRVATGVQRMVLDDEIKEVWVQRMQTAEGPGELTQVYISRR